MATLIGGVEAAGALNIVPHVPLNCSLKQHHIIQEPIREGVVSLTFKSHVLMLLHREHQVLKESLERKGCR